jgi:hypothetical protein
MVNRPYRLDNEPENLALDKVTETSKTSDEAEVIADISSSPESRIKN